MDESVEGAKRYENRIAAIGTSNEENFNAESSQSQARKIH